MPPKPPREKPPEPLPVNFPRLEIKLPERVPPPPPAERPVPIPNEEPPPPAA